MEMWKNLGLLVAMAGWGFLHSLLASYAVKRWVQSRSETLFRFYRLLYNAFAVVSFFPVLVLAVLLRDQVLYVFPMPWALLAVIGQVFALVVLLIGVFQTGLWEFLGLRSPSASPRLVQSGLYRYMRHPLYTAGLLFLWLTPRMSWNQLLLSIGITVYILIGAWFEERKLLREFGQDYAEYRARTPMFLPFHFPAKHPVPRQPSATVRQPFDSRSTSSPTIGRRACRGDRPVRQSFGSRSTTVRQAHGKARSPRQPFGRLTARLGDL